jgi:hypothetical protein
MHNNPEFSNWHISNRSFGSKLFCKSFFSDVLLNRPRRLRNSARTWLPLFRLTHPQPAASLVHFPFSEMTVIILYLDTERILWEPANGSDRTLDKK